ELRLAGQEVLVALAADAAGVTAVAVIELLLKLAPSQLHLPRVDDDDEVADVHVAHEGGLVLPHENLGDLARQAAKRLVGRIDDPPCAGSRGIGRLGNEGAGVHGLVLEMRGPASLALAPWHVKAKVPSNSRVFPFAMGALLLEASRTRPS